MNLKSLCFAIAGFSAVAGAYAEDTTEDLIILDLSKATTSLSFDEINGMWNDTYDDDVTEIESQVFSIVHGSISDYDYWYGFTASNSNDNAYQSNTLLYQYSNMAKGGILLNEDGTIEKNEFNAPVTGKEMPYLVAFPKSEITFNTGKSYEMIGGYFNLNTYTFYSILYGDGFARAFTEGDKLTLTVHGVDSDENEKTLDITLASFSNGILSASTSWMYVDLSNLGIVEELYFTMSSTDSGQWGMNTPGYFCLDKLMVKEVESSSINEETIEEKGSIIYDKNTGTIILPSASYALVYDSMGHVLKSSTDKNKIDVTDLAPGIYVAKSGNRRLKFAR